MKKFIYTGILACMAVSLFAQQFVGGRVYEDANRNGKQDGEKGIAGVAVSNGTDVSLTDAAGKYRLPASDDFIVFVVKPAGYQSALDEFNLPESYYRHKPAGSPIVFYKGVDPTGKLPASVNFSLYKQDEPETFTALIFGDTQPYNEQELEYLKRGIIAEARNAKGVSFGITLGDLVGDRLDLHEPYKQAIRQMGIPWYNVMGNHDMNYDAKEDRLSDESFEARFGPNNYAFNYGKAHFIVLDDILYPHPVTGKGYWGGLRDDQFAFIENNLAFVPHDRLIVVSMHIPLIDSEGEKDFRDDDRQKLYEILKDYPNVLFLSAHTHLQMQHRIGKEQGADREKPLYEYNVGATCGDWFSGILNEQGLPVSTMRDGTPAGYAFLRVDGNQYLLDYKVLGKPDDYQISLYHPKVVPFRRSTSAAIYADFFMGSADDTLEYRIDDSEWIKMQHVEEFDPAYYRYVQDWDYLERLVPGRRPSNPVVCSHLWKARIQTGLTVGEHWIKVRAKDRFGRVHVARSVYGVEELRVKN
ncbi:MAG: calcineurin-like phosphoesterase C-terminal domain-containing protein [Dysgonamonadaceae bacterium]|jgi:3',5'-cyclic AMP phosphodiesterase CpdA|nr:calcineurin-like phosphoesterase C-terminal domain-containing protein [Dysgonamonadaceae bacterium]